MCTKVFEDNDTIYVKHRSKAYSYYYYDFYNDQSHNKTIKIINEFSQNHNFTYKKIKIKELYIQNNVKYNQRLYIYYKTGGDPYYKRFSTVNFIIIEE